MALHGQDSEVFNIKLGLAGFQIGGAVLWTFVFCQFLFERVVKVNIFLTALGVGLARLKLHNFGLNPVFAVGVDGGMMVL